MLPISFSDLSSSRRRFIVGIDLGTTNCSVAYFDTHKPAAAIQLFLIPQRSAHGYEERLPLLPSCVFLEEQNKVTVGAWAKEQGSLSPGAVVQSAKSWLSHVAAQRKEKILPFGAVGDKLSPVEASAYLLSHIREMWNERMAKERPEWRLEEQEIILTLPASFDEVARSLTLEAASMARLQRLTLLEEPQAAFYNWLMEQGEHPFQAGDSILICDVGGGTTDFSLIDAVEGSEGIELRRMAVGKHLLLGGDNMDLALSHLGEKLLHRELDGYQRLSLLHQVRRAKEALFTGEKKELSFVLTGSGSRVVGTSLSCQIPYQEAYQTLVDGFFGLYSWEEAIEIHKGSGIRQMGLHYEAEPSITKHLASFLQTHQLQSRPTHLLCNGGALQPLVFQQRLIHSLESWFPTERPITLLSSSHLELSVARGAAYFGMLRHLNRKEGYIKGGIPRSYYLTVMDNGQPMALTLLSRGTEEGSRLISAHQYTLTSNQEVSFQLLYSHTRLTDQVGDLIPLDETTLTSLPAIRTICQYGKKGESISLPVQLEVVLSPVGLLEIWLLARESSHRWKLEFQLRSEQGEVYEKRTRLVDETLDTALLTQAQQLIIDVFSIGSSPKLATLLADLEERLGRDRRSWPPSLLRSLCTTLLAQSDKRHLSPLYEARFWNLLGFFLRPGIGYPLDDIRIKEVWKILLADGKKQRAEETWLQLWICYRRIASGLHKGQQQQLFHELLRHSPKQKRGYLYAEHLRALSALELVETGAKAKLGNTLLEKICAGKGEECDYWSVGRLGARELLHGSAVNVVPTPLCAEWIEKLLTTPAAHHAHLGFTLAMLARKTNCPEINISSSLLERVEPYVQGQTDLLYHERELSLQEQERFYGDSLPPGLKLEAAAS